MSLMMEPGEIAREYRTAADQKKQLGILAELNSTSREQIAEILQSQGEKVDRRWLNKGVRTTAKPSQSPPQAAVTAPPEGEPSAAA